VNDQGGGICLATGEVGREPPGAPFFRSEWSVGVLRASGSITTARPAVAPHQGDESVRPTKGMGRSRPTQRILSWERKGGVIKFGNAVRATKGASA
jgi:hypothetical protein